MYTYNQPGKTFYDVKRNETLFHLLTCLYLYCNKNIIIKIIIAILASS